MRILVHDFSGHPFQVQLSRALAERGHEVLHLHCASFVTGKGSVEGRAGDPPGFTGDAIDLGVEWDRYRWVTRVRQELDYGRAFNVRAAEFKPDIVLLSNDPLFAKARVARWCRRQGVPWVYWLQDFHSVAMADYASGKLLFLGRPVGAAFRLIERRMLRAAGGVVAITDDFLPLLRKWGIDGDRSVVIENWAPLDEVEQRPKDNPFAREHDLVDARVVLYSGTLGLKHDPSALLAIADDVRDLEDVAVVVVSEGLGATWLAQQIAETPRPNLRLLPYQDWEGMSDVLGTADIQAVLLKPSAGVYSVPSKVLTSLCAGKVIVAAVPRENLAARIVERAHAGVVITPGDHAGLIAAVRRFLQDQPAREAAGAAARAYAEAAFDIDAITDRFESLLMSAGAPRT